MKKIRLKFSGFWADFDEEHNPLIDILRKRYEVVFSDSPDYVIASVFGDHYDFLAYDDAIRIFYTGEPVFPDLTIFDYAVGFDDFQCAGMLYGERIERYFRYPHVLYDLDPALKELRERTEQEVRPLLEGKTKFCNFIYGHESYKGQREELFKAIAAYKSVDSVGRYQNNMPDGSVVAYGDEKREYLKQYKFTIAAESCCYPGFVTEKIMDAFRANSIPIYVGNPFIMKEFNRKAFIYWDGQSETLSEVVDRVRVIDQNNDAYLEMLRQPKFLQSNYAEAMNQRLAAFLYRIFDADKDEAYQRIRAYIPLKHELCLKQYRRLLESKWYIREKKRKNLIERERYRWGGYYRKLRAILACSGERVADV